ncbi:MAG: TRAP transporter small permease [Burkholderiales bacterium]|nr:TRAP transporter small permease [Burkholderiales bacterium]
MCGDTLLRISASVVLFAMMTLTFLDVVLRYLLNRPIRGGFEIAEMMLVVLIFAGLPLVSRADQHIIMDFIDRALPLRALEWLGRAVHMICAAVMFFLTWQIWLKAGKVAAYGDTSEVLRFAIAPVVYFMATMIFITGLVHVFKVFYPERGPDQKGSL